MFTYLGVMWMNQYVGSENAPLPPIRHWCDQGDGLPAYGWFAHDGVNFGIHEVLDQYYGLSMNFVKRPGGDHGGDWSSNIRVTSRVSNRSGGGGGAIILPFIF